MNASAGPRWWALPLPAFWLPTGAPPGTLRTALGIILRRGPGRAGLFRPTDCDDHGAPAVSEPEFAQLIGAVRNGDEQAAEKLVRQYEPYLRHVIHGRLTDPHLRRVFDSLDICQSIFADFFARASVGGFDL